MKKRDVPSSGKRGTTVSFQSRYGQCERTDTPSTKPRTYAQICSQTKFGAASARWNYLTNDQRAAWRAYAKNVKSHPQGGQSGPLTGQVLFTAINRNQAALGLPPYDFPPERPDFPPLPVTGSSLQIIRQTLLRQQDRGLRTGRQVHERARTTASRKASSHCPAR